MNESKRKKVYAKCKGHCAYCGRPITLEEMTADHVVPKAAGGSNKISNLLPCCRECNSSKANSSLSQYRTEVNIKWKEMRSPVTRNPIFYFERNNNHKRSKIMKENDWNSKKESCQKASDDLAETLKAVVENRLGVKFNNVDVHYTSKNNMQVTLYFSGINLSKITIAAIMELKGDIKAQGYWINSESSDSLSLSWKW